MSVAMRLLLLVLPGIVVNGQNQAEMAVSSKRPALAEQLYNELCLNKTAEMNPCRCNFLASVEKARTNLPSIRGAETDCVGGRVTAFGETYPCHNTKLKSFVSIPELSSLVAANNEETNDVWGWTSAGGIEIAIVGLASSTAFVDITDPVNPVVLGQLPTKGSSITFWRDIKVYKDYAYIVSENSGHGLQVIDMNKMVGLGVSDVPKIFQEDHHHRGFGNAHNIAINEDSGYAYIVGSDRCGGGLYMMDIGSYPEEDPSFVGCFSDDGYTHDVQCATMSRFSGREICFASNTDSVTIVDVTNKNNPVQLSRTSYAGVEYTHQGWLSEDERVFIFGDEVDHSNVDNAKTITYVMNVEDLEAPFLVGTHVSAQSAIDHNSYTSDGFLYSANYRAGLQVFKIGEDITSRSDLTLVASFDVYPENDGEGFNGAWSNYPYFPSGNVVISSIERGLFVVSVDTNGPLPANGGTNIDFLTPAPAPTGGSPPTTSPGPTELCFSGRSTVRVEHQTEPVTMQELQVGDRILTDKHVYEKVYAFGHRHETHLASFLQIITNDTLTALEISGEHMIYVQGKSGPVRADSVKVGDVLFHLDADQVTQSALVARITLVKRKGVYAPLTPGGNIVVDGILASAHAGVLGDHEYVEIGNHATGRSSLPLLQKDAINVFLSPWRLACVGLSPKLCGSLDETTGVHDYVTFGMNLLLWGKKQHVIIQVGSLVLVLMVTGVFRALEIILLSSYGVLVLVAVATWKITKKRSSQPSFAATTEQKKSK